MLDSRELGLMAQPGSNPPRPGWLWAADNGCFSASWVAERWLAWLARAWPRSGCLFAAVPDVVADHEATLARWHEWAPTVRELRYPLAFVAQDGIDPDGVPAEADTVFIGGSTDWKLSSAAFAVAQHARATGRWVHVGRVNSWRRYDLWRGHADSCDGTFLAFGPTANLPRLRAWLRRGAEDRLPGMAS